MSKLEVGLLQIEIEEAVKEYVLDRVEPGYEFELGEIHVEFILSDMDGRISCSVSTMINRKSKDGE